MARVRNPNREKAFELYKAHKDIKLIDIANKLGIPEGTVRGWKKKDEWDNKINGTFQEKPKRNGTKNKKQNKSRGKPIAKEVEDVLSNTKLTDKQRLFCIYYIKYFNATKAYQKAYECDYNTATSIAYRLMDNDGVAKEIERLKREKLNRTFLSEEDVFQKYIDIAFADITDFVEFGKKEVEVPNEDGTATPVEVNYVDFKDSWNVDGTLISEVSKGRDGVKVKLQDKMKALQWLGDRMDLLPTATRRRLVLEEKKMELLTQDSNSVEVKDDGFIDALKGTVEEVVWTDEEIN